MDKHFGPDEASADVDLVDGIQDKTCIRTAIAYDEMIAVNSGDQFA